MKFLNLFTNLLSMSDHNPSSLDILDSQISQTQRDAYQSYLSNLNSNSWHFSIVPDMFKQSLSTTDESKFDYLNEDFGRLDSWEEIVHQLNSLNAESDLNTQYKLLFLGRHGFGYHNWAHCHYGNDAWNNKWSKLNGNGEVQWGPDALLTEYGQSQARENNHEWKSQLNQSGNLIKPKKFLTSPLSRCIDTLYITFGDILNDESVLVEENWRETMGVHTCDKRSTKSQLEKKYKSKGLLFEPGFEEEDVYWQKDYRESISEHAIRINKGFQHLFSSTDKNHDDIISITSHSGSLRSQLMVLNHRSFAVGTGGMIPVFVKATRNI